MDDTMEAMESVAALAAGDRGGVAASTMDAFLVGHTIALSGRSPRTATRRHRAARCSSRSTRPEVPRRRIVVLAEDDAGDAKRAAGNNAAPDRA